jgi:hypothetical protein
MLKEIVSICKHETPGLMPRINKMRERSRDRENLQSNVRPSLSQLAVTQLPHLALTLTGLPTTMSVVARIQLLGGVSS